MSENNQRKLFILQTKIGILNFFVNGAQEIYVETQRNYGHQDRNKDLLSFVTIRGKGHQGNVRFKLVGEEWQGVCYAQNGNDLTTVEKEMRNNNDGSDYWKERAVWLKPMGSYSNNATGAAKIKFYDEIKTALNAFYNRPETKKEIDLEMNLRGLEHIRGKIDGLKEKLVELYKTEKILQNDLQTAESELYEALYETAP